MSSKQTGQKLAEDSLQRAANAQEREKKSIARLVSTKDAPRTITTTNGMIVPIKAVSQHLIQLAYGSIKFPEPPTYEIKLPGGDVQTFPHDEKSIKQTPEDAPKWAEYQRKLAEANAEQQRKTLELFVLEGTLLELPEDDSWMKRHKRLGAEIPEDELDRLLYWAFTEVFTTVDDQIALYTGVMRLFGIDEGDLASIEASFRGNVGAGPEGDSAKQTQN